MPKLPFQSADAAHLSPQFLEDLATGYWFSECLFAALELRLFDLIDNGPATEELADRAGCNRDDLARLLASLERLELITEIDRHWHNGQLANLYLLSASPTYMGDFLLYRKYMQPGWQALSSRLTGKAPSPHASAREDYAAKARNYVRATDQLVRRKAEEIAALLDPESWRSPLLDVGGGAGSLCRALLRAKAESATAPEGIRPEAELLDLGEILQGARNLYPDDADWQGITPVDADFRNYSPGRQYGLIVLSNFLHAYDSREAEVLLGKAVSLLAENGVILIHDYFPDRHGVCPAKGPLYDLAMMLHTYNGKCHTTGAVHVWLGRAGMEATAIHDLGTDSTVLFAVRKGERGRKIVRPRAGGHLEDWPQLARAAGFRRAALLPVAQVATAPWVRAKCRHGCARYGKNLQCPPNGMEHDETRTLLDSYRWALLVEGTPPGKDFHRNLLELEKNAFLAGLHKAFSLGAGHCPVCDACPEDKGCRFPDKARPSMEGSGIDVYETARRAGIPLEPVRERMQYVKYLGLLLLE